MRMFVVVILMIKKFIGVCILWFFKMMVKIREFLINDISIIMIYKDIFIIKDIVEVFVL